SSEVLGERWRQADSSLPLGMTRTNDCLEGRHSRPVLPKFAPAEPAHDGYVPRTRHPDGAPASPAAPGSRHRGLRAWYRWRRETIAAAKNVRDRFVRRPSSTLPPHRRGPERNNSSPVARWGGRPWDATAPPSD